MDLSSNGEAQPSLRLELMLVHQHTNLWPFGVRRRSFTRSSVRGAPLLSTVGQHTVSHSTTVKPPLLCYCYSRWVIHSSVYHIFCWRVARRATLMSRTRQQQHRQDHHLHPHPIHINIISNKNILQPSCLWNHCLPRTSSSRQRLRRN